MLTCSVAFNTFINVKHIFQWYKCQFKSLGKLSDNLMASLACLKDLLSVWCLQYVLDVFIMGHRACQIYEQYYLNKPVSSDKMADFCMLSSTQQF